jgi:hypothetical protein
LKVAVQVVPALQFGEGFAETALAVATIPIEEMVEDIRTSTTLNLLSALHMLPE